MNRVTAFLYTEAFPLILSRICPGRIPRSGTAGDRVNCFVVHVDYKDGKPYLLLDDFALGIVKGKEWNGSSYSITSSLPLQGLDAYSLNIVHYYGSSEIRFSGIWDFVINRLTGLAYAKIPVLRTIEKLDQYFFNKKRLITKQRMELLKVMLDHHIQRSGQGFGIVGLMTELYSSRWIRHPEGEMQERKLQLYLNSLVESGELERNGTRYTIKGKAILTIEKFEEEERRHSENVRLQRGMFFLTVVIVVFTLFQTGLIKVSPLLDLTKATFHVDTPPNPTK